MRTGSGGPVKVFSPYHRAWLAQVKSFPDLLATVPPPAKIPSSLSQQHSSLFNSRIPSAPSNKQFPFTGRPLPHPLFLARQPHRPPRQLPHPPHRLVRRDTEEPGGKQHLAHEAPTSPPASSPSVKPSPKSGPTTTTTTTTTTTAPPANPTSPASCVRALLFRDLHRQTTLTTPHTTIKPALKPQTPPSSAQSPTPPSRI
ncbi:MAG: hypothetical protein L6R40_005433 [Gallowayella cf. fulva]|nr:MAG: hypothetical protein L6R40_005433 [Xanthomendoza cf. fulva]